MKYTEELNCINMNKTPELDGTGIRLKLCDIVRVNTQNFEGQGIVYFVSDTVKPNDPFKIEEELFLRKMIIGYFANVQDSRTLESQKQKRNKKRNYDDLLVDNSKQRANLVKKVSSPLHNAFNYPEVEQRHPAFHKAHSVNPSWKNSTPSIKANNDQYWD